MSGIEVLVLLDVGGLEDKEKFEKHVKKEGFKTVEGEDFVYTATSTTTTCTITTTVDGKAYSIPSVIIEKVGTFVPEPTTESIDHGHGHGHGDNGNAGGGAGGR